MLIIVTSSLVGIVSYILGVVSSRKLLQAVQGTSTRDKELLQEYTVDLGSGLTELVSNLHTEHLSDIRIKKIEAEGHIQRVLEDQVAQVSRAVDVAKAAEAERHKEMHADLDKHIRDTKDEFKELGEIFRGDQQSDAARNLLSAAYALVASNKPTRDYLDTELQRAVIRHRRDSGTVVKHRGSIPEGGVLN